MKLFELLERGEVAVQWARIGNAAYTGQVGRLVVGPTVRNTTSSRRHAAKSVVKVSELVSDSITLQVRNVVACIIDAPLFEIPSHNLCMIMLLAAVRLCECRNTNNQRKHFHQQNPYQRLDCRDWFHWRFSYWTRSVFLYSISGQRQSLILRSCISPSGDGSQRLS